MKLQSRKEIKTRRIDYHVFETDDDGRLRRPRDSRFGDSIFSEYGYDTQEEAYAAIEQYTTYGSYFVIPRLTISTEYV